MSKELTSKKRNTLIIPLLIVGVLFFVIGFVVGISGFLTPFLKDALNLSLTESYMVSAAIFSAFVVFGIPAGWVIKKYGYKRSMLFSFFIMALGMALFVPSAKMASFPVFLLALFVGGIGNTLLQAAVNPYVTIIGPHESAAMRMCLLGVLIPKANEKGLYAGMIACILFTAWATLTTTSYEVNGTKELLWDLGNLNFPHHTYMLGVYSHFVLFFVGWGASYLFKGKPVDENLMLYGVRNKKL